MKIASRIVNWSAKNHVVSSWLNGFGYIATSVSRNHYVTGGLRTSYELAEELRPGTSVHLDNSGNFLARHDGDEGYHTVIGSNPSLAQFLVSRNITGFNAHGPISGFELFRALKSESAIAEKLDLQIGADPMMRKLTNKSYSWYLNSLLVDSMSLLSGIAFWTVLPAFGLTTTFFTNYGFPVLSIFFAHETLKALIALRYKFHIPNIMIGAGAPILSFQVRNTRIDINSIPLPILVDVPALYYPETQANLSSTQLDQLFNLKRIIQFLSLPISLSGWIATIIFSEYGQSPDYEFLKNFYDLSFAYLVINVIFPSETLLTDIFSYKKILELKKR